VIRFQDRRNDGLMMDLADLRYVPCRGGVPSMDEVRAKELLGELDDGWRLNTEGHLEREYRLPDFKASMALANEVADIAEREGHHPDLYIAWGRCRVEIWTHKIKGLTESDFYFAAKADRAFRTIGKG
jgi:4a-hydroxytetrahydrobiopterin dehydratase